MDVDTALSEVPVNMVPLLDATDFTTIEDAVAYNAAGMALYWHFVTSAGAYSVTAVTPTTAGTYDWTDQGAAGIYTIEIPASGGASINNDTEGYGWFTGKADGVLPWRGPVIGFRAARLNDLFMDQAEYFDDLFRIMLLSASQTNTDLSYLLTIINANRGSGVPSPTYNNTSSPTVTLADGVTHGGTTAKLRLGSASTTPAFYCTNSAGNAVGFECSSGSHTGFRISNTSSGPGMYVTSDSSTGVIFESTSGVAFGCAGATADIDANELAAIVADTNELQTDLTNGGRLDLLIDAIKLKTDYLPSATAGAAGGVMIAGSNAATTFATLTVSGTTTLSGAVSLGSTLTVTGATSLAALSTSGTVTFNALTVSNALIISGTSTLTGAVSLGSTLGVTGAVTFSNGLASNVTGNITGNLSGTIGSLAAQAKTDVNTEVLDVLNTDTFAEPGQGTPSATLSLASKLGYLFKAWRNRSSQTSTTYSLYNDDATTVDQKSTVSDNGTTYEHGEVTTGP